MFLIIVAVNTFGDYIEKSPRHYSCPAYCEINHKHINLKRNGYNEYTSTDSGLFVWESKE